MKYDTRNMKDRKFYVGMQIKFTQKRSENELVGSAQRFLGGNPQEDSKSTYRAAPQPDHETIPDR